MSQKSPNSYSQSDSSSSELIFTWFNAKLLFGVIITFSVYGLISLFGW